MNSRAGASNSIRSARSSVVRLTREISDTAMIPATKTAEMAMPSGFSTMLSASAYSRIRVRIVKPAVAAFCRRRAAEIVTATAAETIIARMPVA